MENHSSFFKELDELIELENNIYYFYNKIKAYFFQIIFNDANINIKLDNLGTIVTGKTPNTKNKEYYGNDYLWVTPADINIKEKEIKSTKKKLSELGIKKGIILPAKSILITCVGSFGKNCILNEIGSCNQQINAITNLNYNIDYVYYLIEANQKKISARKNKGIVDIIPLNDFKKIELKMHNPKVHYNIGKFFSELESIQELRLKKIELLEKVKTYFLQTVFCE